MDQNIARVLFEEGATLLFLDVPQGTEFGIDCNSWQVGPRFQGVKMIPPGVHFVYYSACDSGGQVAPRTGFFYNFKSREVVVRKWDAYNEDLKEEVASEEELDRYRSNKKQLDSHLGAYPYDSYHKWVSLSNLISWPLLEKLLPESGKILSAAEFVSHSSTTQSRQQEAERMEQERMDTDGGDCKPTPKLPDMVEQPGTKIQYSRIEKHSHPIGCSPSEITRRAMDASYILETILSERYSPNHDFILGEIQFAFVCFLIGQNYDSFDQWKKLVHMMCTCVQALTDHVHLFEKLISVLHFHVRQIPEDFFVDIVSQDNFLISTLQEFFANISDDTIDRKLRKKGLKFRDHLTDKFKWDFTSEPGDSAPVVVLTDS